MGKQETIIMKINY